MKLSKRASLEAHHPDHTLKDVDKVGAALLECLMENDTEAFIEILDAYLRINRTQTAKNAHMARSTVQ